MPVRTVAVRLALAALAVAPAGALAQGTGGTEPAVQFPAGTIPVGVLVGGVDVSGLAGLDARQRVYDQLVTPRSIEIVVISSPAEQATLGNPTVRATMLFEEWFDRQAKPAKEARP